MNNLTQNQRDAKQAILNDQQAQLIARYEKADKTERSAIIRQIDAFLPVTKGDEKTYWLKFRRKLEMLN
ncbi:MAG: hypothetical protein JSS81_23320 [Acidobacteria bacterium]|nr:hypothetical protein [Acidobacteriota bacterium]